MKTILITIALVISGMLMQAQEIYELKLVQDTTVKIQMAIYKDVIVFNSGDQIEPCWRTERKVDDSGEYTYVTETMIDAAGKRVGLIWSPGWNGVTLMTKNTSTSASIHKYIYVL